MEPGPFVDRSAALTAMKGAGVSPRLFFLRRRVNTRAMRAGEMDDQFLLSKGLVRTYWYRMGIL
jgi:hypothetical protein